MITRWPALRSIMGMFLLLPVAAQSAQFSIVIIPDTQMYVERHPEIFEAQMDWIVANRVTEKIIYVAHLGDLKDDLDCDNNVVNFGTGAGRTEWTIVDDALAILEDPTPLLGVPYGVVPGNHDFDSINGNMSDGCPNFTTERPLVTYNTIVGPGRFAGTHYYGELGVTDGNREPGSNEDNFTLFESDGIKIIAINLAYREVANAIGEDPEVVWADALLKAYPNRLGIVTSHYFLDQNPGDSFGPYGQEVYDALSNNPNLFMMLSAHRFGEAWRVETTGRGGMGPVQVLLSDYQRDVFPPGDPASINFATLGQTSFGDSGFMRIMRFDTVTRMVDIKTFIPPVVALPFKDRPLTKVSTYSPGSGAGMSQSTASNLSFTYLGYTTTFDIFECDGVSGGICTTPIGTITFPSDSGMQTDGTDFSLTYTCNGTFCDNIMGYDENDIQAVDWTIDAGTGEITALTMNLNTDPSCPDIANPVMCSQTSVNFSFHNHVTENTGQGGSCDGIVCISGIAINGANLFVRQ